VHFPFPQQAR